MNASRVRCLLAATTLMAAASVCSVAQAVELRGFRGVPWGAGVQRLGASTLASTDGTMSCYRRTRENMMYGDSRVTEVRYCFHNDHFFMVSLQTGAAPAALVHELQLTYGRPDVRGAMKTVWDSPGSHTRVEVVAPAAGGATMLITSANYAPRAQRESRAD